MNEPHAAVIEKDSGKTISGKTIQQTIILPTMVLPASGCSLHVSLIARGLSPFDPDAAMLRAGRIVLERIRESMKGRTDFAFETPYPVGPTCA